MKQRIAKSSFLLVALVILGSCKLFRHKDKVDNGSVPVGVERTVGTVRNTEDCGFYIEVIKGDVAHSLSPVNLDGKYHTEGMRIKFAYEVSVTKPPAACPNFEPVTVSDVTPIR